MIIKVSLFGNVPLIGYVPASGNVIVICKLLWSAEN